MIWAHFIGINLIYILKIVCTNWLALIYLIVGATLPMAVWIMSCCWGFGWVIRLHTSSKCVALLICPQTDRCLLYTSEVDTEIDYAASG